MRLSPNCSYWLGMSSKGYKSNYNKIQPVVDKNIKGLIKRLHVNETAVEYVTDSEAKISSKLRLQMYNFRPVRSINTCI